MATLRNHVERLRSRAGLTQRALAERTEVSRQAVGAIESGATACGVGVALRIALGTVRGRTVARPLRTAQGRFWGTHAAQGLILHRRRGWRRDRARAAHVAGLDFVPVESHACDLYLPADALEQPYVRSLLDALASGRFRRDLGAFGPYDTSEPGDRIDMAMPGARRGPAARRRPGGAA